MSTEETARRQIRIMSEYLKEPLEPQAYLEYWVPKLYRAYPEDGSRYRLACQHELRRGGAGLWSISNISTNWGGAKNSYNKAPAAAYVILRKQDLLNEIAYSCRLPEFLFRKAG